MRELCLDAQRREIVAFVSRLSHALQVGSLACAHRVDVDDAPDKAGELVSIPLRLRVRLDPRFATALVVLATRLGTVSLTMMRSTSFKIVIPCTTKN